MEKATWVKQVTTRLVLQTPDGPVLRETPDLSGLPEWVQEAWDDGWLLMSPDDDYEYLWVVTPYGFAMRGDPDNILINRGMYISLLQ